MPGPILLCDDGSEETARAVREAGALLAGREAIALHVSEAFTTGGLLAASAGLVVLPPDLDDKIAAAGTRAAEAAAERARQAGFDATPLAVEARGPVWAAILDTARAHDAAVIVLGARALSGLEHALLGSVSERVVRHADRPVLVAHPPVDSG